jgi:uncharacterized protein YcbX
MRAMPRVARLSIAPVRSLGLEHPGSIDLTPSGVLEDRRFYLIDDDGRLVDQLIAGALVRVHAHTDPEATRLALTLPDGKVIEGDVELGGPVETNVHGRTATGRLVIGPWAEALVPFAGGPVRIVRCDRPGGTRIRDGEVRNAVSLISDGSLRRLARTLGREALDARRFRMLVELEGARPHEEDSWIGTEVEIGTAVLSIRRADARCAITTHDPTTGVRDLDTLKGIIEYRGLSEDRKALFGVLGEVAVPGRISLGDEVRVRAAAPAVATSA